MSIEFGSIVRSVSGRDKGQILAVIGMVDDKLILSDGRKRRIEKPKSKKAKHVEDLSTSLPLEVTEALKRGELTNRMLYREIKNKFETFD